MGTNRICTKSNLDLKAHVFKASSTAKVQFGGTKLSGGG